MSQKPNRIHVKRYSDTAHGWEATVEPEDRAWIVFVPLKGDAVFYRRVEITDEDGQTTHAYADVELPGTLPLQHLQVPDSPPPAATYPYPIDYSVEPGRENIEGVERDGFYARLNCRQVMCFGVTEHEAVQSLMNYAVQLAVAGSLDHTGRPMKAASHRRYNAVFGGEEPTCKDCGGSLESVERGANEVTKKA